MVLLIPMVFVYGGAGMVVSNTIIDDFIINYDVFKAQLYLKSKMDISLGGT